MLKTRQAIPILSWVAGLPVDGLAAPAVLCQKISAGVAYYQTKKAQSKAELLLLRIEDNAVATDLQPKKIRQSWSYIKHVLPNGDIFLLVAL